MTLSPCSLETDSRIGTRQSTPTWCLPRTSWRPTARKPRFRTPPLTRSRPSRQISRDCSAPAFRGLPCSERYPLSHDRQDRVRTSGVGTEILLVGRYGALSQSPQEFRALRGQLSV